jgi:hypothetical protein
MSFQDLTTTQRLLLSFANTGIDPERAERPSTHSGCAACDDSGVPCKVCGHGRRKRRVRVAANVRCGCPFCDDTGCAECKPRITARGTIVPHRRPHRR